MKQNILKRLCVAIVAGVLVGALVSCNSHLLLKSGDPEVVVIDPPPVKGPPPAPDAGLTTIFGGTVILGSLPDAANSNDPLPPGSEPQARPDAAVVKTPDADQDVVKTVDLPPPAETLVCPSGQVRAHVRDLWS